MTWPQRLKRVFGIDIEIFREYGGTVKVIPKALAVLAGQALACIEDPLIIKKNLAHLDKKTPVADTIRLPGVRAPPHGGLFDPV